MTVPSYECKASFSYILQLPSADLFASLSYRKDLAVPMRQIYAPKTTAAMHLFPTESVLNCHPCRKVTLFKLLVTEAC